MDDFKKKSACANKILVYIKSRSSLVGSVLAY